MNQTKRKPSLKQLKAIDNVVENGGNVSKAMIDAGYSPATAKTPQKLTESKAWKDLMEEYLSDEVLAEKHTELLNSTKIEHLIFSLGPRDEEERERYIAKDIQEALEKNKPYVPIEYVSDQDIIDMLADVNCKVRRIVHRETARDVYYWVADNKARKDALDMAYKLKGNYAPEKSVNVNIEVEASDTIKELTAKLNALHRGTSERGNGGATSVVGEEAQNQERIGPDTGLHQA